MYCPNCGSQIPDSAKYCEHCGSKCGDNPDRGQSADRRMASIMVNKKSEALALILSLIIPGLGQIYNGRTSKGVGLIAASIILWFLSVLLLFPILIYLLVWLYGMYDAFKEAREYNQYLLNHDGNPPW